MMRTITFSLALVAVAAVAGAQTQTPPTQPPSSAPTAPRPAAAQPSAEEKITVTGCLKEGASAGSYVLEAARPTMVGAGAQESQTAVGTAGTSASVMAKTYSVTAKATDELSKHLNHRIEVIGTVSPRRADAPMSGAGQSGSAAPTASPAQSGAASAASAQPSETLTVQSFKMIAATCS